MPTLTGAEVRKRLDHPVIDSDGHTIEFMPALLEAVEETAGRRVRTELEAQLDRIFFGWYRLTNEERRSSRARRPPWWPTPTNALDRATATLPGLLHERMPEFGIDFGVIYPGIGLFLPSLADEELRRGGCRALNRYHAELYRPYADRMSPAAVIPMHTPSEAVEELQHAVGECDLKAVMLAGHVRRPLTAGGEWIDTFGHYSQHDYDEVWRACSELGVAPTFHSSASGWPGRASPENYVHNHLGQFAAAGEATCRSLFFAGVPARFPDLRFAFLEGGVGWACSLYCDLIGHWEKRNGQAISHLDPRNLDLAAVAELFEKYPEPRYHDKLSLLPGSINFHETEEPPELIDEFNGTGIERVEDLRKLFTTRFFFGCEGDDPTNAWAFDRAKLPLGAELGAMFSSDIGHWDVPDMRYACSEAYELLERGVIDEDDFRRFVFQNPVDFWTALNPDFFTGTDIETAVRHELARESPASRATDDHRFP